jgi:YhgE/Pip-like protein
VSTKIPPNDGKTADPRLPVRAGQLLRVRALWVLPLVVGSIALAAFTALYIGSVVDPMAHLRGLPVAVVNEDRGATIGSDHLGFGRQVQSGLLASPEVSKRLQLRVSSLLGAEMAMSHDDVYATMVIPPDLTSNLLNVAGAPPSPGSAPPAPQIEILTNPRAGSTGVNLATQVLQPALTVASRQIGKRLTTMVPSTRLTGATEVVLANPITVASKQYRPISEHGALGLGAFYVALLGLMSGFVGGTIVNSSVDSALGYAANEIGPRWSQRRPVPISRWRTLLIKWAIVTPVTAALAAVIVIVAAGALGMNTPYPVLLWLFTWLCAESVGIGMIVLFAVAGNLGQLIALLLFVYAGIASSGATIPIQALPGPLRLLSNIEPLRQVLAGTRSILYFRAEAQAGLLRGTLAASLGLVFWLAIGALIVRWYDRRRLYRMPPDAFAQAKSAIQEITLITR